MAEAEIGVGLSKEKSKVLIYPAGSEKHVVYDGELLPLLGPSDVVLIHDIGKTKLKELTKFFESILDGSAKLKVEEETEKPKDEL